MSTQQEEPASQSKNTYAIDSESAAEMARLMRQDYLVTQSMGGLFPERTDLSNVHHLLDIACGPGGWVIETAFAHSDIDIVGIDISERMVAYAQAQARVQGLENASFRVMNALKPLEFPDSSFDLVNARLIVTFMPPQAWPKLVQECLRVLRPGGILRFTDLEWGPSNKPALETSCGLVNQAFYKAGQSLSPTGRNFGIICMLRRFLSDAQCQNIGQVAHVIDYSYGQETHEGYYHDLASAFKLLQPFMAKWKVATQEELDVLYQQTMAEMQSEDFCAIAFLLTAWGYKPK